MERKTMQGLFLLMIAIIAIFAVVMAFFLNIRKRVQASGMELKASEFWPELSANAPFLPDTDGFLYGIRRDLSMTQVGLIVRDFHDRQIAVIKYNAIVRTGWIDIETPQGNFQIDVLSEMMQKTVMHNATDSQIICQHEQKSGGEHIYRLQDGTALVCKPFYKKPLVIAIKIYREEKQIGLCESIGDVIVKAVALALPKDVPLPARLHMLALEAERYLSDGRAAM